MGSPISVVVEEIVMQHVEERAFVPADKLTIIDAIKMQPTNLQSGYELTNCITQSH